MSSSSSSSTHTPVSMFRSVSAESSTSAINPSTAARLQRLPTPPRSPGLVPLGRQLTLIEPPMTKGIRFLILDCPTDSTLPFYLAELKRNNVTDVVRCCEPTYRAETLQNEGITVHDWPFRDGAVVRFFRIFQIRLSSCRHLSFSKASWTCLSYPQCAECTGYVTGLRMRFLCFNQTGQKGKAPHVSSRRRNYSFGIMTYSLHSQSCLDTTPRSTKTNGFNLRFQCCGLA